MDLPALGEQVVSLSVSTMKGTHGSGSLVGSGVAAFECHNVAYTTAGTKIRLDKALHEQCPSLPKTIVLSGLEHCADQHELHAKVMTPFVDLHVVAKADVCETSADCEPGYSCITNEYSGSKGCFEGAADCAAADCPDDKVCGLLPAAQCVTSYCKAGSATATPRPPCTSDADCKDFMGFIDSDQGPVQCIKPGSAPSSPSSPSSPGPGPSGPSPSSSPALPSSPGPGPSGPSPSSSPCFAKETTTACHLSSTAAACDRVLLADLVPGDLVLGRDGATTVVAVQHKAVDTLAEMLTFHTTDGASVSMTPDHGLFVDGALMAAADAKVGSTLSAGTITRITKGKATIINAVTADGTIIADGILAASNPLWIAALTVDAPITRALVNAALYAAGDVDSVGAGFVAVLSKTAATLVVFFALAQARKGYSSK